MWGNNFLKEKIKKLEEIINGYFTDDYTDTYPPRPTKVRVKGLVEQIDFLYTENQKLKAIVAELTDYIYGDKNEL